MCPTLPAQLLEGNKYLLQALGSGLWPVMVLASEIVQTFILADFWCVGGQGCCLRFLGARAGLLLKVFWGVGGAVA